MHLEQIQKDKKRKSLNRETFTCYLFHVKKNHDKFSYDKIDCHFEIWGNYRVSDSCLFCKKDRLCPGELFNRNASDNFVSFWFVFFLKRKKDRQTNSWFNITY